MRGTVSFSKTRREVRLAVHRVKPGRNGSKWRSQGGSVGEGTALEPETDPPSNQRSKSNYKDITNTRRGKRGQAETAPSHFLFWCFLTHNVCMTSPPAQTDTRNPRKRKEGGSGTRTHISRFLLAGILGRRIDDLREVAKKERENTDPKVPWDW
jgi:hypothetical protein